MTQESAKELEKTGDEPEAIEASSPDVTDGGPSSGPEAEDEVSHADMIRAEFLKEYGEEEDQGDDAEDDSETEGEDGKKPEAAKADAARNAPEAEKDDGEDDGFRLSDEEFKGLSDGARKRIGHLNTRVKKMERELETVRDGSERFSRIQSFVRENNIQPDNVTKAFDLMARLSAGDYKGFLTEVMPWVQLAQQASGEAFAPDLQSQVDDGYMTEEVAREITKNRIAAQTAEAKVKQVESEKAQRDTEAKASDNLRKIADTINARESEIKASDPDYAHISDAVRQNIEFALHSGARPETPEQAMKMFNSAYEMAKKSHVRRTQPKATPPSPSATSHSRGRPTPKSLLEAIELDMPS